MKLVAVLDVEGLDSRLVDPEEVVEALAGGRDLFGYFAAPSGSEGFKAEVVRAEWADVALRETLAELVDDEEEQ